MSTTKRTPPPQKPAQKPSPHTPGVPAQHKNVPTYPQTDAPVYTPDQVPGGGVPAQTPPAKNPLPVKPPPVSLP